MSKFELDKELIRDLALLLQEHGLSEIEIESKDSRLRVARRLEAAGGASHTVAVSAPAPAPQAQVAAPTATAATAAGGESEHYANHPGAVQSPMVGTAYRAAEPGGRPFVVAGDIVSEGQTVLIIEAMKTFNEIPAPHSGTVSHIFAEDGMPIEYGDVLMLIE